MTTFLEERQQWLAELDRKAKRTSKILIGVATTAAIVLAVCAVDNFANESYWWVAFDLAFIAINIDTIRRQLRALRVINSRDKVV